MRVMGHTSVKTSDRYVKLAAGTLGASSNKRAFARAVA